VTTLYAFGDLALVLIASIGIEVLVASLFDIGDRGLAAVALVTLVTNPVLNLVVGQLIYGNYSNDYPRRSIALVIVAEVAVVLIEWGLLVWALRKTAGGPRKLLGLSVTMNAASFVGVPFIYVTVVMFLTNLWSLVARA